VLESEDGVEFGKETSKQSVEVEEQKKRRNASTGGSLYDQLQGKKDAQQEEYDNNGKLLRAPTSASALEDEDVNFFNDVSEKQKQKADRSRLRDQEEVALFHTKQGEQQLKDDGDTNDSKTVSVLGRKRKQHQHLQSHDGESEAGSGRIVTNQVIVTNQATSAAPIIKRIKKNEGVTIDDGGKKGGSSSTVAMEALLAGYGSSDSSDVD
jgi:hypothetical protein